jgi:hypothetical protein
LELKAVSTPCVHTYIIKSFLTRCGHFRCHHLTNVSTPSKVLKVKVWTLLSYCIYLFYFNIDHTFITFLTFIKVDLRNDIFK